MCIYCSPLSPGNISFHTCFQNQWVQRDPSEAIDQGLPLKVSMRQEVPLPDYDWPSQILHHKSAASSPTDTPQQNPSPNLTTTIFPIHAMINSVPKPGMSKTQPNHQYMGNNISSRHRRTPSQEGTRPKPVTAQAKWECRDNYYKNPKSKVRSRERYVPPEKDEQHRWLADDEQTTPRLERGGRDWCQCWWTRITNSLATMSVLTSFTQSKGELTEDTNRALTGPNCSENQRSLVLERSDASIARELNRRTARRA